MSGHNILIIWSNSEIFLSIDKLAFNSLQTTQPFFESKDSQHRWRELAQSVLLTGRRGADLAESGQRPRFFDDVATDADIVRSRRRLLAGIRNGFLSAGGQVVSGQRSGRRAGDGSRLLSFGRSNGTDGDDAGSVQG